MMYLMEAEYFSDHPTYSGKIVEARVDDVPFAHINGLDFFQAFTVLEGQAGITMTGISNKVIEVLIPIGAHKSEQQ